MKPEIKKLWVDALRSGEYKQTKGCLKSEDGMCCLGVLTDLYIKSPDNKFGFEWDYSPTTYSYAISDIVGESTWTDLPATVSDWAGLDESNPTIGTSLATIHNDGYNSFVYPEKSIKSKTFAEIADLIEEYL